MNRQKLVRSLTKFLVAVTGIHQTLGLALLQFSKRTKLYKVQGTLYQFILNWIHRI